ncbi:MAG: membrane protein insertase YidC, partial [Thermoanaerobaculia bacterium]
MDTRRLLLAFLLSLAVMIVWGKLFPPRPPPETVPPAERPVTAAAPGPPPSEPRSDVTGTSAVAEPGSRPTEVELEPTEAAAEERFVIETESFRAEFTNRGAQLLSFRLRHHLNAAGGPVDLVRMRASSPYPFGITGPTGDDSALNRVLFSGQRQTGRRGEQVLSFRYRGPAGWAEKRFSFRDDGLFAVEAALPGRSDWGLALGPGIRNPSAQELKSRFARRSAVFRVGGEVERFYPKDEVREQAGLDLRWVGIQDTYFLTALVLSGGVDRVLLKPMVAFPDPAGASTQFAEAPASGEGKDLEREVMVVLRPQSDRISALAYWGPKEYERLAAYSDYGLEGTIELGWFSFFSLGLLWGIQWIHQHLIQNYGWAIILMTVLIRVVLFPLTHKSTVSMHKMQQLNPKVQAIRQKYRGKLKDKKGRPNPEAQRKMNEEVMALYKSEGVNPAGGCLPMLFQLPVLFAFYSLLSAAIEIRHAPWILWIRDLSAPDPYYVLPIIMGASQFIQQRMSPPAADPMQRRLFQMMPIFFTVLFLGFPSGLVLYWLTNNVLGIAQQAAYQR